MSHCNKINFSVIGRREYDVKDTLIEYSDLYKKCWESDPNKRPTMQKIVESLEAIIFENKKIDDTTLYVENKSQDHTSASCTSDSTNDMPSDDFRLCLNQSMEENVRNSDIINRLENMSILSNNIENTKIWTRKDITCTLRNRHSLSNYIKQISQRSSDISVDRAIRRRMYRRNLRLYRAGLFNR
ncbi:2619_t:CDS:2, partial [Rhizophagus irregularis]